MIKISITLLIMSVYVILSCLLGERSVGAQENSAESLHLPEVVITGTDQSKIQRVPRKITPSQTALPVVNQSSRDESEELIEQGKLLALMQPQKAEPLLLQAIKLDSSNGKVYLRLGDVYRTMGKDESAADAYQKALEMSEQFSEAHYYLGILNETQLNNLSNAIDHYRAYLTLDGTDSRVNIWLRNAERRSEVKE